MSPQLKETAEASFSKELRRCFEIFVPIGTKMYGCGSNPIEYILGNLIILTYHLLRGFRGFMGGGTGFLPAPISCIQVSSIVVRINIFNSCDMV